MLNGGVLPDEWIEHAVGLLSGIEASLATRQQAIQRLRDAPQKQPASLECLLGVWDEKRLRAALWLNDLGSQTVVFGDPWTEPGGPCGVTELADLLMSALVSWGKDRCPKVFQGSLSAESAAAWREALLRHGFHDEGGLDYFGIALDDDPELLTSLRKAAMLEWIDARQLSDDQFEMLVARTRQSTLDCPYLEGRRSIAEMIAGFRQSTRTSDSHWCVIQEAGEPIGCLLFGLHDETTAEWVYIGLIPEFRHRGIGQAVGLLGLSLARQLGVQSVLVAVDAMNAPAIRLYQRLGFQLWDQRRVFLRWTGSTSDSLEMAR